MPRNRLLKKDFRIHKDAANKVGPSAPPAAPPVAPSVAPSVAPPADVHVPADTPLAPASTGSINSMKARSSATYKPALARSSTIRSVPSFEGSQSSPESKHSGFSSSVNSNTSAMSTMEGSHHNRSPPSVRTKDVNSPEVPSRWSLGTPRVIEPPSQQDTPAPSDGTEPADGQWDSTIGKAGLGKTGRVINKLVSDNEALKRDIQIERLRAEESKQAAKLLEDKMERMVSDYESRLLEANVTKTLLARKERQVETLTGTVEAAKQKAADALSREKIWRDEMEQAKTDSASKVDEATTYAQLMEGRYNAISSHWRQQGDEVKRAVSKMKTEIDHLVDERKKDDDKIQTLRDLCDQQDSNIKQLQSEKDDIAHKFEEYKETQEEDLKSIKMNGKAREDEQERLLQEARDALNKLKWALNVKANVKGAQ